MDVIERAGLCRLGSQVNVIVLRFSSLPACGHNLIWPEQKGAIIWSTRNVVWLTTQSDRPTSRLTFWGTFIFWRGDKG